MAKIEVIDQADPPEDPSSGKRKRDEEAITTASSSPSSVTANSNTKHENPKKRKARKRTKKGKKGGEEGLEEHPVGAESSSAESNPPQVSQAEALESTTDSLVKQNRSDFAATVNFHQIYKMLLAIKSGQAAENMVNPLGSNSGEDLSEEGTITDSIPGAEALEHNQNVGTDMLAALNLYPSPPQRVERVIGGKRFKRKRQEVIVRTQDMEGYVGGDQESYNIEKMLEFVESKEKEVQIPLVVAEEVKKGKKGNPRKKKKRQGSKDKKATPPSSPSNSAEVDPNPSATTKVPSDSGPAAQESELHVLAEKAGFKVNVQYDEVDLDGGRVSPSAGVNLNVKKGSRKIESQEEENPSHNQQTEPETVRVMTDSGSAVKLILIGFTFPNDGASAQSDFDQREAVDWMDRKAAQLKRLAREGKITSKFV